LIDWTITFKNYKPKKRKRRRKMSAKNSAALATETPSDREIVFTRMFNAPRELVWKAWTEQKHVEQWWGPKGFTTTTEVMDVRPGGTWKHTMHGPDGEDYPNLTVYKEVVRPERLVYSHGGHGQGKPEVNFVSTVTFEDMGGKTKLTMRMVFPSAEARDMIVKTYNAVEGGNQTLSRLEEFLATISPEGVADENEFVIEREFEAPRELVWKAWTDPKHLAKWWGPKGLEMVASKLDFRPGGFFHYSMRAPNGMQMWAKFVYRQIEMPERIVFVNTFSDEQGGLKRHFMSETWPLEVLTTVTFRERQGKTVVTLKGNPINASEVERKTFREGHTGMQAGFGGMLDVFTEYLNGMKQGPRKTVLIAQPDKPFTILTRVFDAPRSLVFEAYTKAEHIEKWWGLRRTKTVVDKLDVRPGGLWRFVEHEKDGTVHAFNGEFREVVPQERIVSTFEYEPMPGHMSVNTTLFEDLAGKTKVTITSIYASMEDREGMISSGAEMGANESWDQLEELLSELEGKSRS
jgi:uncharacterized protein YndB with AHSA1/START domain